MTGRPPTRAEQEENARARRADLKRSFAAPQSRWLPWLVLGGTVAVALAVYLAVS